MPQRSFAISRPANGSIAERARWSGSIDNRGQAVGVETIIDVDDVAIGITAVERGTKRRQTDPIAPAAHTGWDDNHRPIYYTGHHS